MSRAKPYTREKRERDSDAPWKHDMYDRSSSAAGAGSGSLAARLGGKNGSGSGSGSASPSSRPSSTLLDRLSGGKDLMIDTSSPTAGGGAGSKLFGFNTPGTSSASSGRDSFSKSARTPRSSRPRGVDSRLVAASLGSRTPLSGASGRSSPATSSPLSIMGAAGVRVRVENLARGTTAEDVKSAFAPTPVLSAALVSTRDTATTTVEVDVGDREAALGLLDQFDGVVADGKALRLTIVRGGGDRGGNNGSAGRGEGRNESRNGNGNGNGNGNASRDSPRDQRSHTQTQTQGQGRLGARLNSPRESGSGSSGKMYADNADNVRPQQKEKSLAARLGGGRW